MRSSRPARSARRCALYRLAFPALAAFAVPVLVLATVALPFFIRDFFGTAALALLFVTALAVPALDFFALDFFDALPRAFFGGLRGCFADASDDARRRLADELRSCCGGNGSCIQKSSSCSRPPPGFQP